MTRLEMLSTLLGVLLVFPITAWLGRKAQLAYWRNVASPRYPK